METEHVRFSERALALHLENSSERALALHLEMASHYPLLQEIPCNAETNQNHQFLLA